MALIPLASQGNFFHIYDFRIKPGRVDEFIRLFNEFDYSDENPMHKSAAQVKDGVLQIYALRDRAYATQGHIFILWMVVATMLLTAVAILFIRNQVRAIERLADAEIGRAHV